MKQMMKTRTRMKSLFLSVALFSSGLTMTGSGCKDDDKQTNPGNVTDGIKTFTGIKMGWTDNTSLPKAINLRTGAIYSVADAAAYCTEIDLVTRDGMGTPEFNPPTGANTNNIAEIQGWRTRRNTLLTEFYNISGDDYDRVKTGSGLQALVEKTQTPNAAKAYLTINPSNWTQATAFKTQDGKYGAIRMKEIKGISAASGAYLFFDYKIQE